VDTEHSGRGDGGSAEEVANPRQGPHLPRRGHWRQRTHWTPHPCKEEGNQAEGPFQPPPKIKATWPDGATDFLITLMNDVKTKSRLLGSAEKTKGVYEDIKDALNAQFPDDKPKTRQQSGTSTKT